MERKEEKDQKVNMLKKIIAFVPGLLYNILIIVCVLLIAIIFMQRVTDSNRSIKGYKIFKVVSGSMEPKYGVGEVVICKEVPLEDIKVGNAIVYRGKIGELNGKLVMHEVIAINQNSNNELEFYARGLHNSKGDPQISESQVLGVVKLKSGILTLLYQLATSAYSSFIIITILVINVFVSFKSGKVQEEFEDSIKKDKNKQKSEKDDLQNEKEELNKKELEDSQNQENENASQEIEIDNNEIENIDKKELEEEPKKVIKKGNSKKSSSDKKIKEEVLSNIELQLDKKDNVEEDLPKKTSNKTAKTKVTSNLTTEKTESKTKKTAKTEQE